MKKSYYFSIWACTIWGILVALNYSYLQGEKQNMDDSTVDFIQKIIIAVLPAFITGLVTFLIGKKSRINNLSKNIDELKNQIGSQEGTTETEMRKSKEKIELLTQQNKLLSTELERCRKKYQNISVNTNINDRIISKNNFQAKDDNEIEL